MMRSTALASLLLSYSLLLLSSSSVFAFAMSSSDSLAAKNLKPTAPSSIKLYYGNMNFWRAECVRMAFFMGDVPFEDIRDMNRDELKEKLTFGAIPILEVGDKILSQTQAMANYAARLAGIHPKDAWEAAKVDECISGCTDVTGTIGTTFRIKDEEEKIKTRKELCDKDGRLWMHLNGLNKICTANDGAYSVGSTLTVADLAIWRLVGWVDSGKLDGIPVNYGSDTFPALATLVKAVDDNEKVKEWKAKPENTKYYEKK